MHRGLPCQPLQRRKIAFFMYIIELILAPSASSTAVVAVYGTSLPLEKRVNKRRDDGALAEDQKRPQQNGDQKHRPKPGFFSRHEETQHFTEKRHAGALSRTGFSWKHLFSGVLSSRWKPTRPFSVLEDLFRKLAGPIPPVLSPISKSGPKKPAKLFCARRSPKDAMPCWAQPAIRGEDIPPPEQQSPARRECKKGDFRAPDMQPAERKRRKTARRSFSRTVFLFRDGFAGFP